MNICDKYNMQLHKTWIYKLEMVPIRKNIYDKVWDVCTKSIEIKLTLLTFVLRIDKLYHRNIH